MRTRLLPLVLLFACGPRQVTGDEVGGTESSSDSSSTTTSTSTTTTTTTTDSESTSSESSSEESGPTPDVPNELPADCVPVTLTDAEGQLTDAWSGWLYCKDSLFRMEAIDCPIANAYDVCVDSPNCDNCAAEEECLNYYGTDPDYCFCGNNCTKDSDCGANEVCMCSGGVEGVWGSGSRNICLPADCAGQADCPAVPDESVPRCRLGLSLCATPESVHCRTEVDDCIYESDCPNYWCAYDPGDERWSCDQPAICE